MPEREISTAILVATANSYGEPDRLEILHQEMDDIAGIFEASATPLGVEVILESPSEGIFLFDQFRSFSHRPGLSILHLAGFASENHVQIEGGLGSEPLTPETFASMTAKLPDLKVLFLNGSATKDLITAFLQQDIPAIFATHAKQDRALLGEIATHFYQSLAKGNTIQQACQHVRRNCGVAFPIVEVSYDLEQDEFIWSHNDADPPNWGIYILKDNLHHLDWHLPIFPEKEPVPERKNWLRPLAKPILGGIVVSALLSMALYLWVVNPRILHDWGLFPDPCTFQSPDDYNIILLPIHRESDCIVQDEKINLSVYRRLDRIHGDQEVIQIPSQRCPVDVPHEISGYFNACGADLILWGSYMPEGDLHELQGIKFMYAYRGIADSLKWGSIKLWMEKSLFLPENEKSLSAVEDVLHWVKSTQYFERGLYEETIQELSSMRQVRSRILLEIPERLITCYLAVEEWEKAIQQYDQILTIPGLRDKQYALERGMLLQRVGRHAEAVLDFDMVLDRDPSLLEVRLARAKSLMATNRPEAAKVDLNYALEKQPRNGQTHLLMAALFASNQQRDSMIHSFQRALAYGANRQQFKPWSPTFRPYDLDSELQELIGQMQE
ncbi:tetratricopeptide repeat protein [Pontibacter sp. G13]|uniref:tetratricopeptide repeat protein n=1 Tax=Pontibacter sp. G13 TaxID=3074898 RepID=UPI00288BCA68|nr:tetratricopeptide repeat protein [Pontibacter sp. G13]WNJ21084.1 tetratricopeptide repeat protein [Pontibacter sp. G13]